MSGGSFDYEQYKIRYIADSVEQEIRDSLASEGGKSDEFYEPYSEATIVEFKRGLDILRQAEIYAQRMDWLMAGDDGEESFHSRLKEELDNWKLIFNKKNYVEKDMDDNL